MSREQIISEMLTTYRSLSPVQRLVLLCLALRSDHSPSIAEIARWTAFSERAVQKALRVLDDRGFIRVRFVSGQRTRYRLWFELFKANGVERAPEDAPATGLVH